MKIENKYIFLLTGILIGGIVVGIFMYSNPSLIKNNSSMMFTRNSSIQHSDIMDAHFIEQMIPHHEDAITMSKVALEKSTRPEVNELAQNILDSQSKEIDQMNQWYKDWFGRDLPTGNVEMQHHGMTSSTSSMHMGMLGNSSDKSNLENAEDFDREFVREMIPHHQMAVMMASMLKNGTDRPEMKKLADDIIAAQTIEIEMMRKWLNTWE